jgi:hypothetical protein
VENEELTPESIRQKIDNVVRDLQSLQSQGDIGRRFEVLSDYKEYLEEELRDLQKRTK